jgi:predicted transglutaminase-like cysteine proteinase
MVTHRHLLSLPVLGCLAALTLPSYASADEMRVATYEPLGGAVRAPSGWLQFCHDWPDQCPTTVLPPTDITMTPAAWASIVAVNLDVNRSIKPVTDQEHYGRSEYWTYPTDQRGDCEDFLLLKRKILMEKGFPRQALLITVVALANGDGHAVLTVRSNKGDYVLDNLRGDVLPWAETGYRFVKRQSQADPNLWIMLGDDAQKAVAAAK